jgi:hypothetical protein
MLIYVVHSGDKIEKNETGGACISHGGEERRIQVLAGKPEGKRPLGRPRSRWQEDIKKDLQKWDVGAWTGWRWFRIGAGGGHF